MHTKLPKNTSEKAFHVALIEWFNIVFGGDGMLIHIPNELPQKLPKNTMFGYIKTMKKFGLVSGFPDLMLLSYGEVLFIELKAKGKKPTAKQQEVHDRLREQGFYCSVVDDFDKATKMIEDFITPLKMMSHLIKSKE